ncbi:hypothetical protein ACFQZS_18975 [Mucilaginibacter calamicampi]|uniref:Uncharacterized protein n=1 Tax=Mucilaginibacter calamicampi TaxID=1302352 RepID=A0ABW2Z328_9SPHI
MDQDTAEEFLRNYCETYHIADAKGALWKWLVLSCKDDSSLNAHVQTREFTEFYDELNKLISSVYTVYKSELNAIR